jgi:hypothetical protein
MFQSTTETMRFLHFSKVYQYQIIWDTFTVVVNALCYKPEGRGFDTRWGEFLNLPNPSGRTTPWGLLSL